ncbi:MAG: Uncharacterized protein CEN90_445 [Parcubacteria group bacterium Licking1014_17]|nr:MAG: Uncharacterized protein CEN90_445 [Parcubacteria group bacterium Licking1014_17]
MRFRDKKLIFRVRELRSEGNTYSEIMKSLKISVPKSTISNWCSGVKLPSWYIDKLNRINKKNFSKAQKMAWVSCKIKRERFLNQIKQNISHLTNKIDDKDVLKTILSVLYLGEGTKWKSHRGLMLGNTDPATIKLYVRLLNICYGIKADSLKCRVSYRADQDIKSLEKYWAKTTGIPLKNFYKTIPDPRTVGKPTRRKNYKGVCVITCAGTHIQLELEAIPKLILSGL